jgi:pilus assembly protein Flp/PilA
MGDCIERFTLTLHDRASSEDGQTMVEYAVLLAFIAIVVLVGVQLLGVNLLSFFSSFANNPL